MRRSKLVVLVVDELGRIEGIVVVIIEGVRADIERLRMLLQLLQLLDDLAPHLLRHCGLDRVTGRGKESTRPNELTIVAH